MGELSAEKGLGLNIVLHNVSIDFSSWKNSESLQLNLKHTHILIFYSNGCIQKLETHQISVSNCDQGWPIIRIPSQVKLPYNVLEGMGRSLQIGEFANDILQG